MEEKIELMSRQFEKEGFTFSDLKKRQFYTFYEMLVEKNKVMNLTAITDFREAIEKHFIDSICICRIVDFKETDQIIDLGTGAGFPGIPLKIAFPDLKITLVDSLNKRIRFIDEVIHELGLTGLTTIHSRAEDLARDQKYREKFDLCVSRAVANLCTLDEYCLPFVKKGGNFISYKSGDVDEEVKESKRACFLLGGKIKKVHKFDLEENKRSFVVMEKVKTTPKQYPRKAGAPSKEPLK